MHATIGEGKQEAHRISQRFDEIALEEFAKEEGRGGLVGA